ncbi:hypothetical protein HR45_00630 [Shewanella mangrovi]|uniref:Uncharacterized protein n=1 Tax=Shewanella mangrovi TaxID=1515746 RepID=A0A094LUQ2_9GAMM|nr:hypothetical protein HR45_00630 [Shewanella mangrovi]
MSKSQPALTDQQRRTTKFILSPRLTAFCCVLMHRINDSGKPASAALFQRQNSQREHNVAFYAAVPLKCRFSYS